MDYKNAHLSDDEYRQIKNKNKSNSDSFLPGIEGTEKQIEREQILKEHMIKRP